MFKIDEDKTIHLTRGDVATIIVSAKANEENYTFKKGDVVRIKVFGRKECDNVVLQKDVEVDNETQEVIISLTKEDTKIEDMINKPKNYWYEVELNPNTTPQMIIGYDEEGEKLFVLYPEGGEIE